MKKLLFIMNPFAGQKKANKVLPEILMLFTEAGYEINMSMTTGPGHATRLAAERGSRADLVVCCGGDGTLNETIAGLLDAGLNVPIGYIPSGTTNDFASSLKLSHNPVQAARDIVEGEAVALTPTEYAILHLLMAHPGKVFSTKVLYESVWQEAALGSEGAVAVHIRHLREKIEINPSEPRI